VETKRWRRVAGGISARGGREPAPGSGGARISQLDIPRKKKKSMQMYNSNN